MGHEDVSSFDIIDDRINRWIIRLRMFMHFHSFMKLLILYDNTFDFRFYIYFFILFHIKNKI